MQTPEEPIPELGNRTWQELEPLKDDQGHLLFRDQLRRRNKDGTFEAIPVRVRVPRPHHHGEARAQARAWGIRLKLDQDHDADMFAELEQLCLLSRAVRTDAPPHAQFADAEELAERFDEGSLQDVLGRLPVYKRLLDPREQRIDDDKLFDVVVKVARQGHLGPLTDIAGHEQPSFLLRMAELACRSPTVQSWQLSQENLMPGPSRSPTSPPSSPEAPAG